MFRKLTLAEKQEKRGKFSGNPIFSILYTPLWRQRGGDLCPEEVWAEGNNLASSLKEKSREDARRLVEEDFDDLCQHYSIFIEEDGEKTRRNQQQAEHSAMMVSFAAFLLLLNVYPERKGHPYCAMCDAIAEVCSGIDGFMKLYEDVRREEDAHEEKGQFIEVADFIERIAYQEEPITEAQIIQMQQGLEDYVDENQYCDLLTMKENERMLSRASDNHGHCFQLQVDKLRKYIKAKEGENGEQKTYKNYIFAAAHEKKVGLIRQAIYPFLKGNGYHIDPKEKRQWQAIVEPLKQIDGLLLTHEDRKIHKACTYSEICEQMEEFFKDDISGLDFNTLMKSISTERTSWKERDIGLTFESWSKYTSEKPSTDTYWPLVKVAQSVYGEILKVIRR